MAGLFQINSILPPLVSDISAIRQLSQNCHDITDGNVFAFPKLHCLSW